MHSASVTSVFDTSIIGNVMIQSITDYCEVTGVNGYSLRVTTVFYSQQVQTNKQKTQKTETETDGEKEREREREM